MFLLLKNKAFFLICESGRKLSPLFAHSGPIPPVRHLPAKPTRLTNRRALNTSVKDQLTLFSAVNFDSP